MGHTKSLPEKMACYNLSVSCIIGIGGAHSSAGKTEAGCAVLRALPGWGAVKCSPTSLYTSVVSDEHILRQEGKDTARYLEAGAGGVLWVQATRNDMEETVEMARDHLSHLPGIVAEGNSAIEVLNPDVVIFIFNETLRFKPSAHTILGRADVIVAGLWELPGGVPEKAARFDRGELGEMARHVAQLVKERCPKR
jgi:hypothetical protein